MIKWRIRKETAGIERFAEALGVSRITAQVMINRGVRSVEQAREYFGTTANDIQKMSGVNEALRIIEQAAEEGRKITIYGDYDVDGVMSTVILLKALQDINADVGYYIPNRSSEGYGLNIGAVERLRKSGCELLIACDNGIVAYNEIDRANELGMTVIVIDHHEPGYVTDDDGSRRDELPAAGAIIDPKQARCEYPYKNMCAAGLSIRFSEAIHKYFGVEFADHNEMTVLAAIATFCDIVDLTGENRTLAKQGIELIEKKCMVLGLRCLLKEKGYLDKRIGEFEIGFIIGPCVNAGGRLEDASLAAELFMTDDPAKAVELASVLAGLNEERKRLTNEAAEKALERIEGTPDKVLVIYDPEVYESVAGIVAGRIKEALHHPVIVLTDAAEEGLVKGSARSIESYDMHHNLYANKDLFERFGGHKMAAGLTMRRENVELLRRRLNDSCELTDDDFNAVLIIDKRLEIEDITYKLAAELRLMSPFGKANDEALFGTKRLRVDALRSMPEKGTMIFTLAANGRSVKGICFGMNKKFENMIAERYDSEVCTKIMYGILRSVEIYMDVVYSIEINEYNDNISVQMRIKDFRFSEDE